MATKPTRKARLTPKPGQARRPAPDLSDPVAAHVRALRDENVEHAAKLEEIRSEAAGAAKQIRKATAAIAQARAALRPACRCASGAAAPEDEGRAPTAVVDRDERGGPHA